MCIRDRGSKAWMESVLAQGSITVIPNFFELEFVTNTGAAWSIFSGNVIFLIDVYKRQVIDTAKCIGIVINNPEFYDINSLEGTADTKNKSLPIIAMPTTAGTAAEVTINYVITDEENVVKRVCVDPNDIPIVSIIDTELMSGMPRRCV